MRHKLSEVRAWGLTIYNPENALQRIMERRKAQPTREEKIAIALKMQQDSALN